MKSFVSFLGSMLKWLAKGISWLLVKLGLWIPAVYSLLFVIVTLITGTKFGDVGGIYLFGLIVTVIFAFAFAFFTVFRKFDKKDSDRRTTGSVSLAKTTDSKVSFVEGAKSDSAPVEQQTDVRSDQSSARSTGFTQPQFYSYNTPDAGTPSNGNRDYAPPVSSSSGNVRISADEEKPRIFRTRMDPNMLIYEYSDRLDFYRKTDGGLLLVSSEPKNR